eukprot:CAMPEP_0196761690 /NCGR_PEP_ID=MMETSP1095-20130614/996_1 /TAXON_ID=96789 ORGANISM="Chromulina nebulosa, Strain UTEXLB2642" /NCGR_SAMPLE_ID=MMETSP1095 /ASSEMBLY_ACC=CAM_ASM_000446 /LENGTH=933 /DNA_ID=CAMNT_0042111571 /DNA_START=182 /DNA_END=2983 /DNA_ORIENTATION=-
MVSVEIEPPKTYVSTFTPDLTGDVPLQYQPVHMFGKNHKGSTDDLKFLLGGKGYNLVGMSNLGLSVPPGFVISTEVCNVYLNAGSRIPEKVWKEILFGLKQLENDTGRKLGDPHRPLLVSVRSGAAISMPGMMDTVLNLGLNDVTVEGLSSNFGEKVAWDSYRRFLNMFGDVVLGIPHHAFEERLTSLKNAANVKLDKDLSVDQLKQVVKAYKDVYLNYNKVFPSDPIEQLYQSILAVFNSWNNPRVIKYCEAEGITGLLGTAVNVQAMCFGNMGETSGTGVCFTRNPNTGDKELYGEYLVNAQGEDVVAGIRTPEPISKLKSAMPLVYSELLRNINILERHYNDMQDIEFTVQEGELFMLQTRSGKRTGQAAVNIAVDMVHEGLCTIDQAIMSIKPEHLKQLLHPQFSSTDSAEYVNSIVSKGLPASPGAAVGKIVFTPEDAEKSNAEGEKCILVREDTSPEDVGGMWAADGILTATGGYTSHASVVARGWGKPCVCGCSSLAINLESKQLTITTGKNEKITLNEGDWMSINGETGDVMIGKKTLRPPTFQDSTVLQELMSWVDNRKRLRVLANADTPEDAYEARINGAQGIGLTRTEHMFFAEDRINVVRKMILTTDPVKRQQALNELLVFQRKDFEGILEAMDGLPVTVRLLDPPLHEFLPRLHREDKVPSSSTDFVIDDKFAEEMEMSKEEIIHAIQRLQEVNPMLGLRGCRLGVVIPELVEMQTRALVEAALNNKYNKFLNPCIEIMIPLIGSASEFKHQSDLIHKTTKQVFNENYGKLVDIKVGTMIEVPRAALTASEIAKAGAEFFSYGTNDLTQMTYGFSRDDVGGFLPIYLKSGILEKDPFQTIDQNGVGELIKSSAAAGKANAIVPHFKCGICGEHGGDPQSVKFFSDLRLNYVSCSPFRIPIARLAAAQAVIEEELAKKKND